MMEDLTNFSREDMVSFGNYLLSDERREAYESATQEAKENKTPILSTEERLKDVSHADFENWMDLHKR